ncbi:hypothetical protein [Candidatus Bathycorpusculum sp.]|uniref:hypothetical protein n=1 Tax=Candidatus Bathycorpusculum sp. TaxID=2994959 RepID=UPI002830F9B3|nr:hypothetical protein [Candidatus Termitimicrobium sp.]
MANDYAFRHTLPDISLRKEKMMKALWVHDAELSSDAACEIAKIQAEQKLGMGPKAQLEVLIVQPVFTEKIKGWFVLVQKK